MEPFAAQKEIQKFFFLQKFIPSGRNVRNESYGLARSYARPLLLWFLANLIGRRFAHPSLIGAEARVSER